MSKQTPPLKVVDLGPKHVALYKKGDAIKVYPEGAAYSERKEYVVERVDHVRGKLFCTEKQK